MWLAHSLTLFEQINLKPFKQGDGKKRGEAMKNQDVLFISIALIISVILRIDLIITFGYVTLGYSLLKFCVFIVNSCWTKPLQAKKIPSNFERTDGKSSH